MADIAAIVPFAIVLVVFTLVGVRFWRIASMFAKPGAFRERYMTLLREELRKAGMDPDAVDLEALRRRQGMPARVAPEVQGVAIKAFTRTLGLGLSGMRPNPPGTASLQPAPQLQHHPAPTPVLGSDDSAYRPPAIDAPSKTRGKAILALLLAVLAAGCALLLRQAT
ncbi:MAG: hypothetical protein JRG84_09485 [Deltaproteobacteria bacterium]|nr:hypothetical protein [Deltaproteobacteria bacterium]